MTVPTRTPGKRGRIPNSGKPRVSLLVAHKPPTYTPPPIFDLYSAVPAATWGMDANGPDPTNPPTAPNGVGDCTIADVDHETKADQVKAGNAEVTSAASEMVTAYSAITGYDPSQTDAEGNNPTDAGAQMQDVRAYWQKHGITLGGKLHKILMFADLDVRNTDLVKWAVDQFGAVGLGIAFPDSAMDQFSNGEPWDVVPGEPEPVDGHAIALLGWDATFYYVLTWGVVQCMTQAFFAKYVDEAWTVATEDFVNAKSGDDALGRTLYQMGQQFSALTGKPNPVPAPTPTPSPSPVPVPAPPVPTPGPVTDVHMDSADAALMEALTEWDTERHIRANRKAQVAYDVWVSAKQAAAVA